MHRISLLLVIVTAGCAADSGDESFIIRNNLAPAATECSFLPELNAAFLSRGQIALDSPTPYLFAPLFESRIVAAEGKESLRTVFIKGAKIELVIGPIESIDATGAVSLDETTETVKFESLFSAPLPPNGGLASGQYDLVSLDALSRIRAKTNPANRIHAQITATATVFGDYYGDQIEAAPYQYPVTACNDCIVTVVQGIGVDGNNVPNGTCPLAAGSTPRLGNACNQFQDGVVDCCVGPNGLECPAPVAAM